MPIAARPANWTAGGGDRFAELMEQEPGTFFLTDYLALHFDALVLGGLGIAAHPELMNQYFGNYRRVVHLAQDSKPEAHTAQKALAELTPEG